MAEELVKQVQDVFEGEIVSISLLDYQKELIISLNLGFRGSKAD